MSTYGLSGSATYSETLTGLDEMMSVIPDNLSNQITARNVRDIVLTLYEDISISLSSSAVTSLSASNIYFGNTNPTLTTVGGIPSGTSFTLTTTVADVLNQMLYPYTAPIPTLSVSFPLLDYGNTQSMTLSWTLTKKSNVIATVNIATPNGDITPPSPPTPVPLSTDQLTSGSYTITPVLNTLSTYTFSVTDGGPSTTRVTTTVNWRNRRYWGTIDLTSIGNPDLTLNPGSASYVGSYFSGLGSSVVTSADGAGSGSGSEFATAYTSTKTYNASGKYIFWAWPTSFGTPTQFLVGGFLNSAFTKILSSYTLTNTYGYTASYDIWLTNTTFGSVNTTIQII
jgi:hypothetical protein